jgi:cyclic beta-1,2-glucan synthetase
MADPASILESQFPAPHDDATQRLRDAARSTASWDVIHRPSSPGNFGERIDAAVRTLAQLEKNLARYASGGAAKDPKSDLLPTTLREFRARGRSLRQALSALTGRDQVIDRLPRVVFAERREEPRIGAAASVYLSAVDSAFTPATFCAFIDELQAVDPLTLDELWNVAAFLEFALCESAARDALAFLRQKNAEPVPDLSTRLNSLNSIRRVDWTSLIEPLILFDALLRQDPAGAYEKMDFESRQTYRKRIAYIARRSDSTEVEVAQATLDLARQSSENPPGDPRLQQRQKHIGYYLVDKGFQRLAWRTGFHASLAWRVRAFVRGSAEDFYIGGVLVLSFVFLALALFPVLPQFARFIPLLVAFLLLLPSAMQIAVELVNHAVTSLFVPESLARLDFSKGIPADCATLVVVPSLLLSESQVNELVNHLEVRFLANRQPNLHFALLTDLPDSLTKPKDGDSHPLVELAIRLIGELNAKYSSQRNGSFLLLHRHRIFNRRQGVWMSWERKRGKLLDLNNLLTGENDAFPMKAGPIENLRGIRYVLTLDSDTQLPHGTASRLVGAIAHPLNQAVIDPRLRIVTSGYGILQPRIGVAVRSALRSRLAAIFSGQSSFDIYTHAVSDAYQDLFGEGIFAGKGIYEVASVHAVLNRRFPRDALLSHDLIEGAYARAGLASDIELIDDHPSQYSAYSRRQHRWLRGDWQTAQWIFSRVPDESGHWGRNPISAISRWKIFDNLRRSLVDPTLLILFCAGWFCLPGGPVYWTIAGLCLLSFPIFVQLGIGLGRAIAAGNKAQCYEAIAAFGRAGLHTLLHLVLLLHQTFLSIDAVIRSLVRRFITGERTLEWETAAQAELQSDRKGPVDRYLAAMPFIAVALAVAIRLFAVHHDAIFFAAPLLVAWGFSGFVAAWLNRPPYERCHLDRTDQEFLLLHALRCWRYFFQFSSARHNYLIPDNVVEDKFTEAPRVSPTNIGLLLNARQAACELGFLTVPEFVALTRRSLDSIVRLEKLRGNLYNWYDTETLQVLGPEPFISSVDSGNFLASIYSLRAGIRSVEQKPLLNPYLFCGLRAYWRLMRTQKRMFPGIARFGLPSQHASTSAWIKWLPAAESALAAAARSQVADHAQVLWLNDALHHVSAIRALLRDYLPWMLPEYTPLHKPLRFAVPRSPGSLSVEDAIPFAEKLTKRIADSRADLASVAEHFELAEQLQESLQPALEKLRVLAADLRTVERTAERLNDETDFSFFVLPGRQILSIGWNVAKRHLLDACYDLFASEARIATFLAIARGDLPQRSWFKLDREHAYASGRFLPFSWTGTMFEYLMPSLWMRSYRASLSARTESACVHVQREFARPLRIPWGISESGSAVKNDSGDYSYRAYGVPRIALSPEATAGPVISPYSTFLALGPDPFAALANLRRMESAGWVGAYGFYEALDYTRSPRTPVLVREWMAHHQGMSLLAVTNLLRNNIVQHWFHANPIIQASDLLLQEEPVSLGALKSRLKTLAPAAAVQ